MLGLRGSFLGFTFNDVHSSVFGLTRTNGASMFQKKLTPDFKIVSIDKPKNDGVYWYGGTYSKRDFQVSFAFEEVTEDQLRRMQQEWNDKKVHNLIFDEEPYKVYSAKITGMVTIKHLCFEPTANAERVFRGEGAITFTCFYPFARSRFPYLEDYTVASVAEWSRDEDNEQYNTLSDQLTGAMVSLDEYELEVTQSGATIENFSNLPYSFIQSVLTTSEYVNIDEWALASRIPSKTMYNRWDGSRYLLYNAGDLEIPFKLYFELPETVQETLSIEISCYGNNLKIQNLKAKVANTMIDKYIEVDSYLNTIQGCNQEFKHTGNLYNEYITEGDFFTLPLGRCPIECTVQPVKSDLIYLYL